MHHIDSIEKIHQTQLNFLCVFSRVSSRRRKDNPFLSFMVDVLTERESKFNFPDIYIVGEVRI